MEPLPAEIKERVRRAKLAVFQLHSFVFSGFKDVTQFLILNALKELAGLPV